MPEQNAYTYAAAKLAELATSTRWPLAMVYFNPEKRSFDIALAPGAADIVRGHGKKIGRRLEEAAQLLGGK